MAVAVETGAGTACLRRMGLAWRHRTAPPELRVVVAALLRGARLLAAEMPVAEPARAAVGGATQTAEPAPSGPPPFSDLVEAAVRGQPEAWNRLFDRFYPLVLRYAMARLGDPQAAEEVAQETFLSAVRGIRSLAAREEPPVEAWFIGIARNQVTDRVRREARATELVGHAAWSGDAGEVAVARLQAAEVRLAMEQLTEDQREVLLRRFVLDQSLEQVAEATGRPVGAVKSLQHRALASLNRLLGGEETES